jgi:hypothetical protein
MKKFIYLLFLLFLVACVDNGGSVVNKEQKKHTNNLTLVFSGIKEFDLDDETSYLTEYMQLIDTDTATYFSFHNKYSNSIYLYDYDSSRFQRKIQYQKEGNNGVGDIQGYVYVNEDSIFVYSYWGYTLYLTNSKAAVLSKKRFDDVLERRDIIYPAPYIQTSTPLKKLGHNIICEGFVSGETDLENTLSRLVGIIYNLEDQTANYVINYPEQYAKYNWAGGLTYRNPYFDVDNQSIIVSFSADHYLLEYSLSTGEQKKHYAGSSSIKEIKSYPFPKDEPKNLDREFEWYMYNPSYQGVFYDKYKNLYYRIARLPVKEYNKGDNGNKKPIIIIVLDSELNYLGEVSLPEDKKFEVLNCFVSKDGFNIQVLTDNEDKMTFYQYNFPAK